MVYPYRTSGRWHRAWQIGVRLSEFLNSADCVALFERNRILEGRLLLRQTVQCAKAPHQIHSVDADNGTIGE